jgi:AcrR family transcriptional regulator
MISSQTGAPDPGSPRRATGRPPKFTAEDAVRAALRIGIADFTMGEVARTLGVTTPALYRLFPGRADLVDACFRHILTEMPLTPPASEKAAWREILSETAEHIWQLLTRYPGLDLVLHSYPGLLREVWPGNEYLHHRLRPLGYSLPQATFAAVHIGSLTTAATARLRRRTAELTRPSGTVPPPRTFRAEGVEITDPDELYEASYRHWRQCIDFFLDQLGTLDGNWPEHSVQA